MAAILEFTVDYDEFALGRALRGRSLELERIIPTSDEIIPFFWTSGSVEVLENQTRENEHIRNLQVLERVGDYTLYSVEWGDHDDVLSGLAETEATILEAYTEDDTWMFRVRFPDHEFVAAFYNYCTSREISIHVERVYTLTEEHLRGRMFDLTNEQREALVLAYRRGYFNTPRETSLEEIADALDISQQALSDRIRRGNKKILGNVLFPGESRSDSE